MPFLVYLTHVKREEKLSKTLKKIKKNYNSTEQTGLRIKMGEKVVKIYMGIVFTNSLEEDVSKQKY